MRRSLTLLFGIAAVVLALTAFALHRRRSQSEFRTPSAALFARAFPDDARQILEHGDTLTLFAIKDTMRLATRHNPDHADFHGYPIVGNVKIPPEKRTELLAQLYDGLAGGEKLGGAMCFMPHHALRATRGKRYVDLVICFQCEQVQVYTEKRPERKTVGIAPEPRAYLDQTLNDAGVTVSP